MSVLARSLTEISKRTEILFASFFALVVAMIVLPLPTILIDAMISFNLAFAFIVLVTTICLRSVLDISTFPAVLLIGTVFRLALTISTTRLVLAHGDAGDIIHAFGSFVVAGNVVVGLVVFLIVALVQFVVVTKGAERIAEVGARFTLDAMPGKQLAIDSDLRNGHIDAPTAQKRRARLGQESQFFGAMDGAMRFVKGDAIAGLVIVCVNLMGGLAIGIFQRGLSFSEAAHLYSLLSVGDGLVSQIPSMLMAVAAATIVTRVNDDNNASLGADIGRQLSKDPKAIAVAAALTGAIGFVPGFPVVVLWPIAILLGALAFVVSRRRATGTTGQSEDTVQHLAVLDRAKYGDPVVATVSPGAFAALEAEGFADVLEGKIRSLAHRVGVAVTVPTFNVDPRMGDGLIHIQIENVPAGLVSCTTDFEAVGDNIVRIVRRHIGSTFSSDDVAQWLTSLEPRLGILATDARAQVPTMLMVAVMRRLLDSGVTVSQPRGLLETLLAAGGQEQDPDILAERARQALGKQIAFALLDRRGVLPVIAVGPAWDEAVRRYRDPSNTHAVLSAEDEIRDLARQIGAAVALANDDGRDPVMIVEENIRSISQVLLIQHNCRIPVLSPMEIDADISCEVVRDVALTRQAAE